jgi:hypothetical protein
LPQTIFLIITLSPVYLRKSIPSMTSWKSMNDFRPSMTPAENAQGQYSEISFDQAWIHLSKLYPFSCTYIRMYVPHGYLGMCDQKILKIYKVTHVQFSFVSFCEYVGRRNNWQLVVFENQLFKFLCGEGSFPGENDLELEPGGILSISSKMKTDWPQAETLPRTQSCSCRR